jgi:hypothetical protein
MPVEMPEPEIKGAGRESPYECECPQDNLTPDNEAEFIEFSNSLQLALALKASPDDTSHERLAEWFEKYSTKFREVFEEVTGITDPESGKNPYFKGCKTIKDIPEGIWADLKKRMYESN